VTSVPVLFLSISICLPSMKAGWVVVETDRIGLDMTGQDRIG
jgi:hypothetical protein